MKEMVESMCIEIHKRSDYLNEPIETIYFGGGTPSVLNEDLLSRLLNQIYTEFNIAKQPEITLEANPEDLSLSKCNQLKEMSFNRLSIGFQTFENAKLGWMNRGHDAEEAIRSFDDARNAGFENISIDLIYALPNVRTMHWQSDLLKAIELDPEHISLYGLTIEDQTVFGKRKNQGKLVELPEEEAAKQYLDAIETLKDKGYSHYEVSNFAKTGFPSKHNQAYWDGVSYLGIGPGAHSYNGLSRQFNVRNNAKYIKSIANGSPFFEVENLTKTQLLNEHILTGLRRAEGISFKSIAIKFGIDLSVEFGPEFTELRHQELIQITNDSIHLTSKGFLVADDVALQLFFDE